MPETGERVEVECEHQSTIGGGAIEDAPLCDRRTLSVQIVISVPFRPRQVDLVQHSIRNEEELITPGCEHNYHVPWRVPGGGERMYARQYLPLTAHHRKLITKRQKVLAHERHVSFRLLLQILFSAPETPLRVPDDVLSVRKYGAAALVDQTPDVIRVGMSDDYSIDCFRRESLRQQVCPEVSNLGEGRSSPRIDYDAVLARVHREARERGGDCIGLDGTSLELGFQLRRRGIHEEPLRLV